MRRLLFWSVLLSGISLLSVSAGAGAQEFTWALGCGEPVTDTPVVVDGMPEGGLAPGECARITGERSGYEGGFSPVMEDHRLLLIVTGKNFPAGTHEAEAIARLTLPRCRECDGYCAEASGTAITRTVQSVTLEEEQNHLIFDFTDSGLFPQWELMGAEIQIILPGIAADAPSTGASISLKGWPWCM